MIWITYQIRRLNSTLIPGQVQTVRDLNAETGLNVRYRIGCYSTEVYINGNLADDLQFTAWQTIDLGWIPMPNRPINGVTQYLIDPFYVYVQVDGQVQIVSSETRKGSNFYIAAHLYYLNASI